MMDKKAQEKVIILVTRELKDKLKKLASKDNRSMGNYIRWLIEKEWEK